jgi:hypothetical protein
MTWADVLDLDAGKIVYLLASFVHVGAANKQAPL